MEKYGFFAIMPASKRNKKKIKYVKIILCVDCASIACVYFFCSFKGIHIHVCMACNGYINKTSKITQQEKIHVSFRNPIDTLWLWQKRQKIGNLL